MAFSKPLPGSKKSTTKNFLEVSPSDPSSFLRIDSSDDDTTDDYVFPNGKKPIYPTPGFCIKSKTSDDIKVFMNICCCEDIPEPNPALMSFDTYDWEEAEAVRLPIGFGLPHYDKDKSGNDCVCFDLLINNKFCDSLKKNEQQRAIILTECIDGISQKYNIFIRKDCCLKLMKPYHGTLQRHFIRSDKLEAATRFATALDKDIQESTSISPLLAPMRSISLQDNNDMISEDSGLSVRNKKDKTFVGAAHPNSPTSYLQQSTLEDPGPSVKKRKEKVNSSEADSKFPKSIFDLYQQEDPEPIVRSGKEKLFVIEANPKVPTSNSQPITAPFSTTDITFSVAYRLLGSVLNGGLQYVLEAKLPDVLVEKHNQIKIFVSEKRVFISENDLNYHTDITLPSRVLPEKSLANYSNGVLTIVMFGYSK